VREKPLAQEGLCQAPIFSRLQVAGVVMRPKDEITKALLPSRGSGDAGVNQINDQYEDWRVLVFLQKVTWKHRDSRSGELDGVI
jgi:hypothetical protein